MRAHARDGVDTTTSGRSQLLPSLLFWIRFDVGNCHGNLVGTIVVVDCISCHFYLMITFNGRRSKDIMRYNMV